MAQTVKVDLKDPVVQLRVKNAGIRWRMRDYEKGLDLDVKVAERLGLLKAVAPKKEEREATQTQPPPASTSPPPALRPQDALGSKPSSK